MRNFHLTIVGLILAGFGQPLVFTGHGAESGFAVPATDEGLPGAGPIRRYEWFKKLWERRRSAWADRLDADRGAVVFLGDSITQGWGDDFKGAFPGLKKANRVVPAAAGRCPVDRNE
jgi:hypothetical protein